MFYRYTPSGARISVDLDGVHWGEALFLLGGSPYLEGAAHLLDRPGLPTLAINNTPCVFRRPTFWIAMDRPPCMSPHIFGDPVIQKFVPINRSNEQVHQTGKTVRQFPNVYFFGTRATFTPETLLAPDRDICWWKTTFPASLQLAWRLGFREVYLVGCGFAMDPKRQYAWRTNLKDSEQTWSQRTYDGDLVRLQRMRPVFDAAGFKVVSCTPDSRANGIVPYRPLLEVVEEVMGRRPPVVDTMTLVHSSALKEGENDGQG